MYLAMLIYSPITTAFSYFGALCGTFAGILIIFIRCSCTKRDEKRYGKRRKKEMKESLILDLQLKCVFNEEGGAYRVIKLHEFSYKS